MNTQIRYSSIRPIAWLILGLTASPLLTASAEPRKAPCSERQRLEWLLAKHDVRNAIYASPYQAAVIDAGRTEQG